MTTDCLQNMYFLSFVLIIIQHNSNTTLIAVRHLTVLSRTIDKVNDVSNHFGHMWRHEYIVNLRETQQTSKLNIKSQKILF